MTTVLCGADWSAGVDVRGGGPGVRESEALAPENLVGRAHALVLAGGSVFGLAAADGVAAALSVRDVGLHLRRGLARDSHRSLRGAARSRQRRQQRPGACTPPYRELGIRALRAAGADFALGSVGAGRGAMAGLRQGRHRFRIVAISARDSWSARLVALNSVGSALMPDGKTYWAWAFELEREFGGAAPPSVRHGFERSGSRTSHAWLALGRLAAGRQHHAWRWSPAARISRPSECKRVAIMAHDGIARAVRPAHTPFDGDTVFALAAVRRRSIAAARAPRRSRASARRRPTA